jgi:hypothetical protein
MPRIVPSQVVTFIGSLPQPVLDGIVKLSDVEPFGLSATLDLVNQIPDELLTMDGATYSSFVQAKAHIRDILARWRSEQTAGHQRYSFKFLEHQSPLFIIRGALSKCPDESPAPSSSDFIFIPDPDLRTNLRNDMGSINRALSNGEWKASTVLAGSVIEALLLWVLRQHKPIDVALAATKLVTAKIFKTQPSSDLEQWVLHEYTEVSASLGIIKPDTANQVRLARGFRNLIHPGRAQRLGQTYDRATALSAVAGAEHVIRDLTP